MPEASIHREVARVNEDVPIWDVDTIVSVMCVRYDYEAHFVSFEVPSVPIVISFEGQNSIDQRNSSAREIPNPVDTLTNVFSVTLTVPASSF